MARNATKSPAPDDPTDRAKHFASKLSGGTSTKRMNTLRELFERHPDAGAIQVYVAWRDRIVIGPDEAAARSAQATPGDFDPAEDNAPAASKVQVKKAYDGALDAGLTDEAAYLRGLTFKHQRPFGHLLRREFDVNGGD